MTRQRWLLLLALALGWVFALSSAAFAQSAEATPKNIIYLIGDGMGVGHITAAATVHGAPLAMEQCSIAGLAKTSAANAFVTDSAAAGTALATGYKTNNGVLGLTPEGRKVPSILSYAKSAGKATGIVVSCSVTHATPAAFVAHQKSRKMQEEVAADYLTALPDVFIGGGRKYFEERSDGKNLSDALRKEGYRVAYSLNEVIETREGRLAALLAPDHPPRVSKGREGMLERSVESALSLLSQNRNGFVLMVEGSQIDWGGHANDLDFIVEETLDFDRAVAAALKFAAKHGDTLVVVTADHETGGLQVIDGSLAEKRVTPGWGTKNHSAVMVPVLAEGPGATRFGGVYENTEIFHRMMALLGLKEEKP